MEYEEIEEIITAHPAYKNSMATVEEWLMGFETPLEQLHSKEAVITEMDNIEKQIKKRS